MPEISTANMLVYRDGRKRVLASELVRELEHVLASLQSGLTEDGLVNALLRAGELECAMSDAGADDTESVVAITDQLARMSCRSESDGKSSLRRCQQLVSSVRHGVELTVSRPEGFAYYALHPLDFADTVSTARLGASCVYVVGIRSIGTTLSATVAAKLNADGVPTTRTTVRPEGHPYDRCTSFSHSQRNALRRSLARGALFLVCDEGPGRSGSSLLSVAEALEREGVSREHIVLFCSHQPDVDALCGADAPQRWRCYRSVAAGMTKRLPQEVGTHLGADDWRELFIGRSDAWPAAWPQIGRLKFLSRDRQKLLRFEGHGHYGEPIRQREQLLAESGFGARCVGYEAGFGIHELVGGKPLLTVEQPSLALLTHVAKYCAWRATGLPATVSPENCQQLEHMATHNIEQEFGFGPELRLELERPVICDGRMQPYKWQELTDNQWIKLDASTHGDDHFFPGPTDIAWDLAGVCVEWQLGADERESFLAEYQRISGDNPAARLQQYEIAYTGFRLGWSRMAAASVSGSQDERRLLQDAARYRAVLDRTLVTSTVSH